MYSQFLWNNIMLFSYQCRQLKHVILSLVFLAVSWGTAATAGSSPVVPPSLPRGNYYQAHPAEWQALLAKLAAARAAGPKQQSVMVSSPWQTLRNPPPTHVGSPHLLTDGTVIVQQTCTGKWYKLTPDIKGSYVDGTWTAIASMPSGYAPLYYASQVLNDGRFIVNGGEYNATTSGVCPESEVWTTLGAIYDPVANSWTSVAPPAGWTTIGDASSVVLPNGTYMLANCCTTQEALWNPTTLAWTATGTGKFDVNAEENWTILPNGSILTSDSYLFTGICGTNTEIYTPSTGTWASAGNATVQLSDCTTYSSSFEVGLGVLRPGGSVVEFSAIGAPKALAYTEIFYTDSSVWATGDPLPTIDGQFYTLADAPIACLPTGNILFAAAPEPAYTVGTHFFEYSQTNQIAEVADTPNASIDPSYVVNFVVLPTGQILETDFSTNVEIYTPTGTVNTAYAPVIGQLSSTTLNPGGLYLVAGAQLNGLTQGAVYGDDFQSDTNFPLVRISNTATGHVFYAKTSNFSTKLVAPGTISSAQFLVPSSIESGPSTLVVIANGVPSASVAVTVSAAASN
jgi:hypothetical protein